MKGMNWDLKTTQNRISFIEKAFDCRNTFILSLIRSAEECGFTREEAIQEVEMYSGIPADVIDMAITSDFTFDF